MVTDLTFVQNFYLQMEAMEKNVFMFGADTRSKGFFDNKGKIF